MKRALSTGEKWLFASPLLLILIGVFASLRKQASPEVIEIAGGSSTISHVSFSPDSKRLLVFSAPSGERVSVGQVYDVASRAKLFDLQAPPLPAQPTPYLSYRMPDWSSDGSRIVAPYNDNAVGTVKIPEPWAAVPSPSASSGTPKFHFNCISKIALWDAKTGTLRWNARYAAPNEDADAFFLRFSSDGKQLVGESPPPRPLQRRHRKAFETTRRDVSTTSHSEIQ